MRNEFNLTYEIAKVEKQIERANKRVHILKGELKGLLRVVGFIQDDKIRKKEQARQIDDL